MAGSALSIRKEERDGTALLFLSGELDLSTRASIEESIAAAQRDHRTVIVDLAELSFMDSNGIHVFLDAAQRAGSDLDRFGLVNSRTPVRRVFEVTGTDLAFGL